MFKLPELSYGYDDLDRAISGDIMRLHHQKHHQGYVDKLNSAVEGLGRDDNLEAILRGLAELPEDRRGVVRNQGGGHFNHSLFWQWMSPDGGGQPAGQLGDALNNKYGSFQGFVDTFSDNAKGLFGSGWVWLMPNLEIMTSPNQDNPIMDGHQVPILGLDVWEHAYYLDYKNARSDYIANWWSVVNWRDVEKRYVSDIISEESLPL